MPHDCKIIGFAYPFDLNLRCNSIFSIFFNVKLYHWNPWNLTFYLMQKMFDPTSCNWCKIKLFAWISIFYINYCQSDESVWHRWQMDISDLHPITNHDLHRYLSSRWILVGILISNTRWLRRNEPSKNEYWRILKYSLSPEFQGITMKMKYSFSVQIHRPLGWLTPNIKVEEASTVVLEIC